MGANRTSFKKGMKSWNAKNEPPLKKECRVCNKSFQVAPWLDRVQCCSVKCGQILRFRTSKHPRWIEDRTKLCRTSKQGERRTSAYFFWRKSVWERDEWKCKINDGDCSGRLEAHHILGWTAFPKLRYEVNNGITLCHAHHPRVRAEEKRLIPTFMELVAVSKTLN